MVLLQLIVQLLESFQVLNSNAHLLDFLKQ